MTAQRRWFTGGWVFDGTGRERFRGDILTENGVITDVVEGGLAGAGPDGAELVDVSGVTLLPGLIDAHAHVGLLSMTRQPDLPPAVQAARIFENLRLSIDQGFTTLRDLGGVDGGLVEAIETGLVEGPRLLPSGQVLSQTSGHGDLRGRYSAELDNPDLGAAGLVRNARLCDGPHEVRRAARDQFRRGATQLKLYATGGQLSEGDPVASPQFTEDELRAAVETAKDRDTYVTVHAHTNRGIHRALRAGVRCFEHASMVDRETAVLLRDAGAVAVPTLTVCEVLKQDPESWGVPGHWLGELDTLASAARDSVRILAELGVPLGSGADLIGIAQDKRGWEISLKAEVLGAAAAIESATRVNAQILGIDQLVGTLEPGKQADIAGFACDPLRTPEVFREDGPAVVVRAGDVLRNRLGG